MFAKRGNAKTRTLVEPQPPKLEGGRRSSTKTNPRWQSLALSPRAIQPKLAVNQPGDRFEQEADRVAERVMRMPDAKTTPNPSPVPNQFALTFSAQSSKAQRQFAGNDVTVRQTPSPVIQLQPAPKPKVVPATIHNVDQLYGPLTEELAKQVFTAYGSPLTGNEKELISAFTARGFSGWMGLAIIKQESSFANNANNPSIDERNVANPFSVHLNTDTKKWPKGCAKNLLLKEEVGKTYTPGKNVKQACAAKGFRLSTFAESAQASAKTMAKLAKTKKGIDAYRETGGYTGELNGQLNNILIKIKLKLK
jgi:hypothetical protein